MSVTTSYSNLGEKWFNFLWERYFRVDSSEVIGYRETCGRRIREISDRLHFLCETDLDSIVATLQEEKPRLVIIDSIQTMYTDDLDSAPGSVSQVKDCTMALLQLSKSTGTTVFVVGHVNKEGAIAGPKVLEHMVDCVLYFEGEKNGSYRLLRAAKNRGWQHAR